jgi:PKD repeat protein
MRAGNRTGKASMTRLAKFRSLPVGIALAFVAGGMAGRAAAQCTRFPRAAAGADISQCIPAVGRTDFPLSGVFSRADLQNGPIVSYCWTTNAGTFVESGLPTACLPTSEITLRVPNSPGRTVVNVALTVTDAAGCSDADDLVVDLQTAPVITLAAASQEDACLGEPLDLIARAANTFDTSGLVTLRWDQDITLDSDSNGFPDDDANGVVVAVSNQLGVVSVIPQRTGSFTARLTVSTTQGTCTSSADVPYAVGALPVVRVLSGPALACPFQLLPYQAQLAAGSLGSDLTWDFDIAVDADGNGDPTDDVEAQGADVSHAFPSGGVFTIRASAVDVDGCRGFEDKVVNIRQPPVVASRVEGPGCDALAVRFTDESTGVFPIAVSWDFGDGTPREGGPVRTHVFASVGTYLVQHFVTDSDGCGASESRLVDVTPEGLRVAGIRILDGQPGTDSTGNENGFPDPGERVIVLVDIVNESLSTAFGVTLSLTSPDPEGVLTILRGTDQLPAIPPNGASSPTTGSLEVAIQSVARCGSSIPYTLHLAGGSVGDCATNDGRNFILGAPGIVTQVRDVALTGAPGRTTDPASAWTGSNFATVYIDPTSGTPRVYLQRQSASGELLGQRVRVDAGTGSAWAPRLAWSDEAQQILVAWLSQEPSGVVARFQRLDAGAHLVGPASRVDTSARAKSVDVASGVERWLLAFVDQPDLLAPPQAFIRSVTFEGIPYGSPVLLGSTTDDAKVRLAVRDGRGLVAWIAGGNLRLARTLGTSPPMLLDVDEIAGASGIPAIASVDASFVAAFESGSLIDLAMVDPTGGITRDVMASGRQPAITGLLGRASVAWVDGDVLRVQGATPSGGAFGSPLTLAPAFDAATSPSLAASPDGQMLAAWEDSGGSTTLIRAAILLPTTSTSDCPTGVLGDIAPPPDGNGRLDIGDPVIALRISVGLEVATPEMIARGDVAPGVREGLIHHVHGNGVIDIGDAVVLLQAVTELIRLEP